MLTKLADYLRMELVGASHFGRDERVSVAPIFAVDLVSKWNRSLSDYIAVVFQVGALAGIDSKYVAINKESSRPNFNIVMMWLY